MITYDIIKRKPVIQVPAVSNPALPWQPVKRIVQNANEWKEYLDTKKWQLGELICYDWAGGVRQVEVRNCSVVLDVCHDFDKLKWTNYDGKPTYLYLMGLGGYIGTHTSYETRPYIRWSNDEKMRKLTEEEKTGLLNDNVLDYIKKITLKYASP